MTEENTITLYKEDEEKQKEEDKRLQLKFFEKTLKEVSEITVDKESTQKLVYELYYVLRKIKEELKG